MMDSFLYISARFSTMNRAKALGTGRSGGLRNGEFVGCSFLSTSHQSRITSSVLAKLVPPRYSSVPLSTKLKPR